MTFKEQWTLENVYPNGVEGDAFLLTVSSIRKHIEDHVQVVQNLPFHPRKMSLHGTLLLFNTSNVSNVYLLLAHSLEHGSAFALKIQNLQQLKNRYASLELAKEVWVSISQGLDALDDDAFHVFIERTLKPQARPHQSSPPKNTFGTLKRLMPYSQNSNHKPYTAGEKSITRWLDA